MLGETGNARQQEEADNVFFERLKALKLKLLTITLSPPSGEAPVGFIDHVNALLKVINSQPAGQKWSKDVKDEFDDKHTKLIHAGLDLIEKERKSLSF